MNVADFLIFVDDFGKTVTCGHAQKVQLVIQNQFNDAVWDTSRNAAGVLTITITKKLPPPPPPPPPVSTPVNTNDRAVLVEFYNAMGGDNWRLKRHWLSDRPLNEWYGVSTTENGRVDSLNLWNNGLTGSLPESLGNLTNLVKLRLQDKLLGSLPESLGNLTNLVELDLRYNELTGAIPESLGNLTNLVNLNLRYNNLSGPIPESLTNLTNLGRYRRGFLVLGLWLAAGNPGLCLPVSLYDWAQGLDRKGISDVWDGPGLSDCN